MLHEAVREVVEGSYRRKSPPELQGAGYVVRSLEAALWAFARAASFEQAVLDAVNLGDDADTTGAVCGQFAGACWGETGIEPPLRRGLAQYNRLRHAAQRLIDAGR